MPAINVLIIIQYQIRFEGKLENVFRTLGKVKQSFSSFCGKGSQTDPYNTPTQNLQVFCLEHFHIRFSHSPHQTGLPRMFC